ncbi:hypothetical protein [Nostoc sp. UIC 10630]|uniref:hypothetical protein n=1 Tax=Nostoc sp. UIC 10630 TaxID=2100146 RepID=UPI00158C1C17|nr:hypothetical protein [Nostoc sp. UIC 10630]
MQANQLTLSEQIDRTRTGNIVIQVVNSKQQPVFGVEVKFEQVKHEFEFGTALSTEIFAQGANRGESSEDTVGEFRKNLCSVA